MKIIISFIIILLVSLTSYFSTYIIYPGQFSLTYRLDKVIKDSLSQGPGLYFKIPFIDEVKIINNKISTTLPHTTQIESQENNNILLEFSSNWQVDSLEFFFANNDLEGIAEIKIIQAIEKSILKTMNRLSTKEISQNFKKDFSPKILAMANESLKPFGIKLLNLYLLKMGYDYGVNNSSADQIYNQIIAQQTLFYKRKLALSQTQIAKIQQETQIEIQDIELDTYTQTQQIFTNSQVQSMEIYAQSFNNDPAFFEFHKTLNSYKEILKENANYIFSTHSSFFKFLNNKN